jgi:hypothetical protein
VYALWQSDEIIYFGFAQRDEATIQSCLLEHFLRQRDPSDATHYSWEICRDVRARLAELMREHEQNFKRLPRYNQNFGSGNDPRGLP